MNRVFRVKGESETMLYILGESDDGLRIRIIRRNNGAEEQSDDMITRTLFETCLSTGYLSLVDTGKLPLEQPVPALTA